MQTPPKYQYYLIQLLTLYNINMNFLKKMLGIERDLRDKVNSYKGRGTLFEVVKDTRKVQLKEGTITFLQEAPSKYCVAFTGEKEEYYQLPIHLNMSLVSFTINKGKPQACFEWQLEEDNLHVGCYMDTDKKQEFRDIICLILKEAAKDENIKDHLSFCKELAGIPVYKTEVQSSSTISSSFNSEMKEQLNEVLIAEAQKQQNKMVHSCSLYEVELRQRKLINENMVFVLKAYPNFEYQFQLINATAYVFLRKTVDSSLNYEINMEKGYIRWIDIDKDCQIIEVNFLGKRDAALSLKYNMLEVMYELRERRKLQDQVSPQQIAYMKKMSEEEPIEEVKKSKIVEIYKQKEEIQQISQKSFLYEDPERKKGVSYDNICQAKIGNFSIAALGSLMQNLSIGENSEIKQRDKRKLFDRDGREVEIGQLLLHDEDTKGFIRGRNGKLYYQDLNKGKLIAQFDPSPKKGIINICPQFKLADASSFKTFKAISERSIYEIDPRTKEGVGSLKDYSSNPQFETLSATGNGSFVTGAKNGQIRFYKQIGKNANNKFTSAGDPVIHLDTTKDGKWVLATFRRYLRLIPTETEDEDSLFERKVAFNDRPTPIKLDISLDDLQRFGIRDFSFLAAKFDESKDSVERYIITGFGQYTVIWNLGKVVKGDKSYIVSKSEGRVVQADFRFNDPSKLIMATTEGLIIKENKIKK